MEETEIVYRVNVMVAEEMGQLVFVPEEILIIIAGLMEPALMTALNAPIQIQDTNVMLLLRTRRVVAHIIVIIDGLGGRILG